MAHDARISGSKRSANSTNLLPFLFVLLLAACGEPLSTPEPIYLSASGSMAMASLVTELADAFSEQDPLVSIDVTGLGTEFGLDALQAGEVDFALASWLPADLEPQWRATAIARDGMAVIIHPDNPLSGLGLLQLQDLFSGRAYEWRAVGGLVSLGPVQPVSRELGSGARTAFETLVMEDRDVTPLAVVVPSSQAVVDFVAENPGAIGYVSMAAIGDVSMELDTPEVKVLKIEGALPTPESTGQGSYPLTRELWLVTADPPSDAVQDFVNFALSPAGQQIVGQRFGRLK
jgi:phosphate transport system substrate-binding protein